MAASEVTTLVAIRLLNRYTKVETYRLWKQDAANSIMQAMRASVFLMHRGTLKLLGERFFLSTIPFKTSPDLRLIFIR